MIDIDTSSKQEQRKFGTVMAVAIAVLGCIRWALHGFVTFPAPFFGVALAFLLLGLVAPKVLQPVFVAWIKLAMVLNWIMTRVFLTIAFYLLLTPVRVVISVFSEDPLKRVWLPHAETYWEAPEEQPKEFDRYRNQY